MARTPSMTAEQAESILGPRGNLTLNNENKPTLRKWLSAHGFPALFAAGLSMIEMQHAYNKLDGSGLAAIQRKLDKAKAADDGELGLLEIEPGQRAPIGAGNGDREAHPGANMDQERVLAAIEDMNAADAPKPAPLPKASPVPPAVNPAPVPANAHDKTAMDLLRELILQGYQPGIDAEAVRSIVQQEMAGIAPRIIEIRKPDAAPVRIDGITHPEFERIVRYLSARGPNNYQTNVLLVGPAGSGKSTLIKQVAQALSCDSMILAGSAGVTEGDIIGKLLPKDGGAFTYRPSRFVQMFSKGNAVIGLDELFAFDPNCALALNMPLSNGGMNVPLRDAEGMDPYIPRGENVYFIATDNTYGTGANPLYTGRAAGDAATNDRWMVITIDYDKRLEESIGTAGGLNAAEMAGIWELRDKVRENQLRRVIGTRAFQKASIMKQCGDNWRQIRDRLLEGWTKDERTKVGA